MTKNKELCDKMISSTKLFTSIMQDNPQKSTENLRKNIIQESDICVRCGLCLPHCPTYLVAEVETESPRGRIAMAKALAESKISLTHPLQQHLENCLGCMACEAMCPAKVPYHDLMINTREFLYQNQPQPIPKLLTLFLNHLRLTSLLQHLYNFYQRTGLAWFLNKTKLAQLFGIQTYQAFMPEKLSIANFKAFYPAKESLGNVALFIGCINRLCDANTIFKAITLLNGLGYNVHIPTAQACCGAIHLHNGSIEKANDYLQINARVFENLNIDSIVTLATGCHSSLIKIKELSEKLKNIPMLDINDFIIKQSDDHLSMALTANVLLVHTPCTLRNSMKQPKLLENLLLKLGVKQFKHLQGYGCCGAAGLNMWNNPTLANKLALPLIQQITAEKPDFVITANIGCQLHLQKNLKELGLNTQVLHPLQLIFTKNKLNF